MPLEGLDKLVARGQNLLDEHDPVKAHSEFNRWVKEVSGWINSKFPDSGLSADWAAQDDSNLVIGGGYYNDPSSWSQFRIKVRRRLKWLSEITDTILTSKKYFTIKEYGSDIFIVHGRDHGTKETVARFIEKIDLKPLILHEQPNKGRTIIEKFEDYSNVGFAIILLTPDDLGSLKDDRGNLKPRARQNVILELGYFLGKLGRDRVCALYKEGVEMPSDYEGVIFISMKDNSWKLELAKEIKAAGINIDLNKAISE